MSKRLAPLTSLQPDPAIAEDEGCFARFSIDDVSDMMRVVGLEIKHHPISEPEFARWYSRYQNPQISLAYIFAANELGRLKDEAHMRGLISYDELPSLPPEVGPFEMAESMRTFVRNIDRWVSTIDDEQLEGDLLVLRRAVLVAAEIPEMIERFHRHKQKVKPATELARSILAKRPKPEIDRARQKLRDIAGQSEARALMDYLAPEHDSGLSLEYRARCVIRDATPSRSGKHTSVLAEFVRGDLAASFECLFGRKAGGSTQDGDRVAEESPYGHFVRFAAWFLKRIGHGGIKPTTITSYVTDRATK